MTAARLALVLLLPVTASAQLTLVTFDGTSESVAGAVYDFGKVAAGDVKDVRFRARNTGGAAVNLTTLSVSGAGFVKVGAPALPVTIAGGAFLEFVARFSAALPATYSANVQVNNIGVILLATSVPAPTLTVSPNCTGPDPIDFGRIQRGLQVSCDFSLRNATAQPMAVSTLTISGAAFRGSVSTPFTIPGGGTVTFTVNFAPPAATIYAGILTVDTHTFRLTGSGFDPALPKPSLEFDSAAMLSGQQRTLTLRLPAASPVTASGLVSLTFTPAIKTIADDPAILFVASGSRKVSFAVNQGDTRISLGGQAGAVFQTGTTSGIITFSLSGTPIEGDPTTAVTIAPALVSIDTASVNRRVNDLDIQIIGFDNTYTAGAMSFTFFDAAGKALGAAINADFTANFRAYFTSAQAGSAFLMRATFPVTGDVKQVAGVQVDLTNAAGVAHTQRLNFQ